MYIKRQIEEVVKKWSKQFPVLILSGSRQVGKSTMLQMIKDSNMKYISLDDLDVRNLALNDPKYFLETYSEPAIIDEIQYAPNLLSYIKIKVDEQSLLCLKTNQEEKCLYWLTGSQQFSLMKGVTESLAGRAGILDLASFSLSEIEGKEATLFKPDLELLKKKREAFFSFKTVSEIFDRIFQGGMPKIVAENKERNSYFSSYVRTYIERDIKELSNVGKTIEFYNFMQYIAVRTAQEIEYKSIANAIGVDSKTIKSWISILEATGIIYILHPYSTNVSNRIIKTPKLYFMDTGLCSWLAKWPSKETLEAGAMSGAIFETYVVSEIIKSFYNQGKHPSINLYYYRDKDQKEIDLLYVESDKIYPIEIKKGVNPSRPNKNFSVLNKYKLEIMPGIVLCMAKDLTPINKTTWLCPVELI